MGVSADRTTELWHPRTLDADALPTGILEKVDLTSPATTVALLKMNAIIGLQRSRDVTFRDGGIA
jgi:hypothetical protein